MSCDWNHDVLVLAGETDETPQCPERQREPRGDQGGPRHLWPTLCSWGQPGLEPLEGPSVWWSCPRDLLRIADVYGAGKSKDFPFIWKEGKEKPRNYSVNYVRPLEKYQNMSKTRKGAWAVVG